MPRRVFNLLTLASLLACVACVVMWQRSYRGCDVLIGQHEPKDRVTWTSEFGQMVLEVEAQQRGEVRAGWSYFEKPLPRRFRKRDDAAGFAAWYGTAKHYLLLPSSRLWGVAVPYWSVFILAGILPAVWVARMRRARRERFRVEQGLCARCGYDLRASGNRCPECGAHARTA